MHNVDGVNDASACLACPDGANCAGALSTPSAIDGFYRDPNGAADAILACPVGGLCTGGSNAPMPQRGFWGSRDEPTVFFQCVDIELCPGGALNVCAFNRDPDSLSCSLCRPQPQHFLLYEECIPCPANPELLLVGVLIALFVIVGVAACVTDRFPSNGLLMSIVVQIQTIGVFSTFSLEWPPLLRQVFAWFAYLAFDIDLAGPECSLNVTYTMKWYATVLPALVSVATLLLASFACQERLGNVRRHLWQIFTIAYLGIMVRVLQVFRCNDGPADTLVLTYSPDLHCFEGEHLSMFLVAILLALPLFVIAVPLRCAWATRRREEKSVHVEYNFFWRDFVGERDDGVSVRSRVRQWWPLLMHTRRLLFAVISNVVFQPIDQAYTTMAVLGVALLGQLLFNPFRKLHVNVYESLSLLSSIAILALAILAHFNESARQSTWLVALVLLLMPLSLLISAALWFARKRDALRVVCCGRCARTQRSDDADNASVDQLMSGSDAARSSFVANLPRVDAPNDATTHTQSEDGVKLNALDVLI